MALGVAFLAVGGVVASHRDAAAGADQGNPLVAESTGDTAAPTKILVIGDSYTAGSAQGGNGNAAWTQLAASDLLKKGYTFQLVTRAAGGAGYVEQNTDGNTMLKRAQQADGPYDLVVFFGSRNDDGTAMDVQSAAASAYAAIRKSSPNARLLVIGPPWINGNAPPKSLTTARDQVKAAAQQAGATFVDPLAEGWFSGQFAALIGADHIHPTDAGHRHMADLIVPRLEQELAALGATASPAG